MSTTQRKSRDTIARLQETVIKLTKALEPFAKLGGPNDGVMPAYHDLPDDVVVYNNSGECITAGEVRAAREALGILHAPRSTQRVRA